jgi:hypothetical protein
MKTKAKTSLSIKKNLIDTIVAKYDNKSKFIEYCMINELKTNIEFKIKIDKMILL